MKKLLKALFGAATPVAVVIIILCAFAVQASAENDPVKSGVAVSPDAQAKAKACAYIVHATLAWASNNGGIASPALESLRDVGCTDPEVIEAARREAIVQGASRQLDAQYKANWGDKAKHDSESAPAPKLGGMKIFISFKDGGESPVDSMRPEGNARNLLHELVEKTHQKIVDHIFSLGGESMDKAEEADLVVRADLVSMDIDVVPSLSTPCPWRRVAFTTEGLSPNIREASTSVVCNNDYLAMLDKLLERAIEQKKATTGTAK